jgi:hypothetical protein
MTVKIPLFFARFSAGRMLQAKPDVRADLFVAGEFVLS